MNTFDGFPPDAWRVLDLLANDNTAACFDRHRCVYQSVVAGPSHALSAISFRGSLPRCIRR